MTSKALDLATMGHALHVLTNELTKLYHGEPQWYGFNEEQKALLAWYNAHRDEISKLSDLEALASDSYRALNDFLQAHGFDPQFQPFDGIGVVSILDMLVEWLSSGTVTSVQRYDRSKSVRYPAFYLRAGVTVFDAGSHEPLIRVRTKSGSCLWLTKAHEPASGMQLAITAQQLLAAHHSPHQVWTAGVKIPMLDLDTRPDLDWMIGTIAQPPKTSDTWQIVQAFQQFKLRINEHGARAKVATGFAMERGMAPSSVPYELDSPFIGFFTQQEIDTVPIAAFWADTDVWKRPAGTLEEL